MNHWWKTISFLKLLFNLSTVYVTFKYLLMLCLLSAFWFCSSQYSYFHCYRCNSPYDIWPTKYNLATTDYHCTQLRLSWPHDSYLQLRHSTCIWLISAVCGRCGRTKSVITSCAFYAFLVKVLSVLKFSETGKAFQSVQTFSSTFRHPPNRRLSRSIEIEYGAKHY